MSAKVELHLLKSSSSTTRPTFSWIVLGCDWLPTNRLNNEKMSPICQDANLALPSNKISHLSLVPQAPEKEFVPPSEMLTNFISVYFMLSLYSTILCSGYILIVSIFFENATAKSEQALANYKRKIPPEYQGWVCQGPDHSRDSKGDGQQVTWNITTY